MLAKLKPEKFAETILNLNNGSILKLNQFFEYRYFPEKTYSNKTIQDHQRQEKELLSKLITIITQEINAKRNRKKIIRKHVLNELNSMIKESLKRL
jgi:hypothetical protein